MRRISAENLSARLNLPATDDEVGRLAGTFDNMLARLDDSFRRERQFTADASHELRTPLAAMQAILSVVRSQRRAPEDYERALADLSEEAERLRGLAEYLLQSAGPAAPSTPRETVDLSDLLQDVTDSFRPLAAEKGVSLTYAGAADLCMSGDRDGLARLFVNLMDNAVKYTSTGKIDVVAQPERDTLRVTVADTGSGIAAEHLPRIFNRFYRADAARTSPGSGLGLAIAREIARAHGGSIEVGSTLGIGSTFTVQLPLH